MNYVYSFVRKICVLVWKNTQSSILKSYGGVRLES